MAYVFEFWIALIAIFTVWSQVGGQGHLDLIAWFIKLPCVLALAWSAVRMTSAMVENPRAWNRGTVKWFLAVLALCLLAIGITYWYHLHEVPDEPDTDQNSATTVHNRVLDANFPRIVIGRDREYC
jgi:magnesium-transporting ATPase (P-type)